MTTNNIKDVKSVDDENFDYLLAETNFKIQSVFRSRNKAIIEPNVPMISKVIGSDNQQDWDVNAGGVDTKVGGTFDFVIDANDYSLYDLRDAEFDVIAQFYYTDTSPSEITVSKDSDNAFHNLIKLNSPVFGNQCLLSLFQNIELFIDDVSIARNAYPGFSSNAEYALRYPHCKTLEQDFEVNGFVRTTEDKYDLTNTGLVYGKYKLDFKNQSINGNVLDVVRSNGNPHSVKVVGTITQRIKLSDIFPVVDTLPPIYNHKTIIRFQRASHNNIICNTATYTNSVCNFCGFTKFKLFQDALITTDQFINAAKKYYSSPKETLITQDKQLLVPIITQPEKSTTQSFNLNIDTAYKNKLLTICIPRTTNFANQYNSIENYYYEGNVIGVNNSEASQHYDVLKAPANSYTYGGLKYLTVETTSGLVLYKFDMENDGIIQGKKVCFDILSPNTQINFKTSDDVMMANYQNVYDQYRKARYHFFQSEDEALDFNTFLKEYCIYCVDLSLFTLSPGENIRITLATSDWAGSYNPYFTSNYSVAGRYISSTLICNLFCDKVLRLLPNRRVELADMMTTSTVEVDNSNMA
jgi:hypothetical protein